MQGKAEDADVLTPVKGDSTPLPDFIGGAGLQERS